MDLVLREPTRDDAAELGRIVFDAFGAIAEQHRFPPDFPSREITSGLVGQFLDHPGFAVSAHGLVFRLYITEMKSASCVPDDLHDYGAIHHRSNHVVDGFTHLVDAKMFAVNSDLDPILVEVKRT